MALERDEKLLEYAFSKKIILTFPTSLLAILKGLSMTIEQALISKNIDEIQSNAVELYKRLKKFTDYFNTIGINIKSLNKTYNDAVGSYENRLMSLGNKFAEMTAQKSDLDSPQAIEESIRQVKDKYKE